ncbi:MAG: SRPBCC domain-containing protein [Rhizobacter sp.]|nr:SRPBCC domain-containing protein [Ferruginibacter sp.]
MKKKFFSVNINASKEKIWDILWSKGSYEEWTAVFAAGSTAVTDWQQGSKVLFTDGKGEGMVGRIAERRNNEYLSIEHLGMSKNGKEILEGPEVDPWKGAHENYTLKEQNGVTTLDVDMDMTTDMEAYFDKTWPKALDKVKEMAEA